MKVFLLVMACMAGPAIVLWVFDRAADRLEAAWKEWKGEQEEVTDDDAE